MEYVTYILILAAIYSILAISLDLVVGHTGILSLAQAALAGIGAYASALLVLSLDAPYWLALLAALCASAVVSLAASLPSLRLRGDYFVIATLAFQVMVFTILNNWLAVTRGPLGIPGIPRPTILGWDVDSDGEFMILVVMCAVIAHLVIWRIVSSPFGRVLHAIREDEAIAKALGKNTLRFKVTAFAVSAALAGSAGSLYAHYITYIDPTSFTVFESILVISMVIIGGAGSTWGPLIGAFVLVTLPEALRFVGLPSSVAANLRQIIYGTLLVVMMMYRPRGLVGTYAFRR